MTDQRPGDGLSHAEISELLGAYALDAVEPWEAEIISRHLETCPRCAQEVDAHRETAGALAFAGNDAPEQLWERIQARLEEPPPALDMARIVPMGQAGAAREAGVGAGPGGNGRAGAARRGLLIAASGVAAAALVAAGLLGAEVADLRSQVDQLARRSVAGAPDAVTITMRSPDGTLAVPVVLGPEGNGLVLAGNLPPLPSDETYQLWALAGGQRISIGVLGNDFQVASFKAHGSFDDIAVTREPAPGVSTSTKPPVVIAPITS